MSGQVLVCLVSLLALASALSDHSRGGNTPFIQQMLEVARIHHVPNADGCAGFFGSRPDSGSAILMPRSLTTSAWARCHSDQKGSFLNSRKREEMTRNFVLLHQDAFAADYQDDGYRLLGNGGGSL